MTNVCCICLESVLSGGAVGATTCGHCFHTECFEPWQSRVGGVGRRGVVKCPTCNTQVKLFHPLYLDFGRVLQLEAGDEDDDESIGLEDDEEEEESDRLDGPETSSTSEKIIPIDDDIAVVERTTPAKQRKLPESPSVSKRKLAKYKAFAKRQRRTIASLQTHVDELKESNLDQQHIIDELNARIGMKETEIKRLECANLSIGRHSTITEATLRSTELQLKVVTASKEEMEQQIHMLQNQQRKESSRNMTEVRRCMEERPKLLEEIKALKAQLMMSRSDMSAAAPKHASSSNVSKQKQLLNQLDFELQERKQLFSTLPRDVKKYSKRANDMIRPKSWKDSGNNPLNNLSSLSKHRPR
jgi:chromosome segregation ATPase